MAYSGAGAATHKQWPKDYTWRHAGLSKWDWPSFSWVRRDVNQVAYELAKWGFVNNWNGFVNCGLTWLYDICDHEGCSRLYNFNFVLYNKAWFIVKYIYIYIYNGWFGHTSKL